MDNRGFNYEWESFLDGQLLSYNRCQKKAYISDTELKDKSQSAAVSLGAMHKPEI